MVHALMHDMKFYNSIFLPGMSSEIQYNVFESKSVNKFIIFLDRLLIDDVYFPLNLICSPWIFRPNQTKRDNLFIIDSCVPSKNLFWVQMMLQSREEMLLVRFAAAITSQQFVMLLYKLIIYRRHFGLISHDDFS